MNKLRYRKIFSKRLGMLVAVAECTRSQGKHAGEGGDSSFPRVFGGNPAAFGVVSYLRGIALAVGTLFAASALAQLPTGGNVI
ncbi:MAG: ESPR domain-containing protein, partial [Zoogloeaceae bacterium]|nr:ESPR domain-containing protein [Zoogloeaceae bacterium]